MGKQENIKIFEDTETLCKTNSSLKQSIKNSICNQKLILQNQRINSNNQKRYEKPANIIVSKREHYKQHRHIKILRQRYIILLPQLIQVVE